MYSWSRINASAICLGMMLDHVVWLAGQILLFVLSFPAGYLVVNRLFGIKFHNAILVRFIVYIATGIATISILAFTIGFLSLTAAIICIILLAAAGFYFFIRENRNELKRFRSLTLKDLYPIALLAFTFYLFGRVAISWKWVPGGDSFTHEFWTSLILLHDRVPLDFMPFNSLPIYFTYGIHSSSAIISRILHIYPGEALLIFSSFIVSLIPLLIFTYSHYKTKSLVLSTLAFSGVFLVHFSRNLELWTFGYFYNGVYPAMTGVLFGLLTFALLIEKSEKEARIIRKVGVVVFGLVAIGFTYYAFIPPFLFACVLLLLLDLRKKVYLSIFIGLIISITLASYYLPGTPLHNSLFGHRNDAYYLSFEKLSQSYSFIIVIASVVIAVPYAITGRRRTLSIFLLSFALPLIISSLLPSGAYAVTFGAYYLGTRILPIMNVISLVYLAVALSDLGKPAAERIFNPGIVSRLSRIDRTVLISKVLAVAFILLLFSPVYYRYLSDEFIRIQGRFNGSVLSADEYKTSVYLASIATVNDPILADPTDSSIHLLGFKALNSVLNFPQVIGKNNQTRAAELVYVFQNPADHNSVTALLKKYGIKYIMINESEGYFDYWSVKRGEQGQFIEPAQYRFKPLPHTTYLESFNNNTSLQLEYKSGFTAVYKVID